MKTNCNVTSLVVTLTLGLAAATGCAVKTTSGGASSDPVGEGSDAFQAESDSESLGNSLAQGGASGGLAPASAADLIGHGAGELSLEDVKIGDQAKAFYQPAGCLTVTDDAANKSISYVFNDCTGPYGLVHVTGTVAVNYSSSGLSQLTLKYSATALKINKSTIDWTATGNITANGAARDMIWDGKLSGTTGKGRAFERTNHKELKWTAGTDCVTVNGESDGTVTGHELKTDVINFSRCKHACPEAGSEIKITDVTTNRVYDVKWNAGDATYTGPEGRAVTFKPICAE